MKKVEILVAVRNEPKNILIFTEKIKQIKIDNVELSVVFLEDGSSDNTLEVLRSISNKYDFVNYYSLENSLGQYVALFFGISKSDADAVITMDVDGGHPIDVLKEMITKYIEGYDFVQGHRVSYKSKEKYRSIASYLYNLFFLIFIGLNIIKQNSVYRLMNRKAYQIFRRNSHWGYSLKANFKKSDDIKICYVPYATPEREYGISNYNLKRLIGLSIRVALSQLSILRFLIFILTMLIVTFLLWTYNIHIGFAISILVMTLLTVPFIKLKKVNPVSKIKILEKNKKQDLRQS